MEGLSALAKNATLQLDGMVGGPAGQGGPHEISPANWKQVCERGRLYSNC